MSKSLKLVSRLLFALKLKRAREKAKVYFKHVADVRCFSLIVHESCGLMCSVKASSLHETTSIIGRPPPQLSSLT